MVSCSRVVVSSRFGESLCQTFGLPLALIAFALGSASCKKPPPPEPADAGAPAPDHLAVGEIAEGREKAFALALPLQSRIYIKMRDEVEVESTLRPEDLSNFVRARVQTTKIAAGTDRTTFEDAVVPNEPKRLLHIEVRPAAKNRDMKSSMVVRDVTPLPAPPKVSDEEAWKRAGRGPDGKPLDPNHVF